MIPLPWPDPLSRIMIVLGCFLILPVLFCGRTPFRGGRTYLILTLFCTASCLAPLASSWFGFVLWMELASIALVLLIAFRDPFGAKLYLYVQLAAGGMMLLGAAQISTLPLLRYVAKPGLRRLRQIHSGKIRLSFTIFGFALLGIFLLFSL